jgi:hypothetical protein
MLIASDRAAFTSVTAYATIAENVSREIRNASENNLICGRFAEDFTRTLRSAWWPREFGKPAEFRLHKVGWPFLFKSPISPDAEVKIKNGCRRQLRLLGELLLLSKSLSGIQLAAIRSA